MKYTDIKPVIDKYNRNEIKHLPQIVIDYIKSLNEVGEKLTDIAIKLSIPYSTVRYYTASPEEDVRRKQYLKNCRQKYPYLRLKAQVKRYQERDSSEPFTYLDVINKYGENPVCYLTGEQLDWKINASLDHKIPASKGGKSNLENLGICSSKVNLIKNNLTPEEFIEFCKKIAVFNT